MILKHLSLTNFRSYARLDTDIPRRILLLSGGNAQGKTSFLEALFYCASFSSPLALNDRQLISFNTADDPLAVARIVVRYEREGKDHKMEIRLIRDNENRAGATRKEILLDGIKTSAQKAIGSFTAVLFLPQMTRILEGAPQDRRRYLNIMLSQSVPGYALALSETKQILTRRNALLKLMSERRTDPMQLDYWDNLLAGRSVLLIKQRAAALRHLEEIGNEIHRELTDGKESLTLRYRPGFDPQDPMHYSDECIMETPDIAEMDDEELKKAYLEALKAIRSRDIDRGSTNVGPHHDDFSVSANGIDLSDFGSRGQIRTSLLSLKLSEIEWMKQHTGTSPLLLLDETLAELDERRSHDLLERLQQYDQAILTTTDQHHFTNEFTDANTIWHISGGMIDRS